ncbi:MFS transporter [Frigoriglobus tundricola]|uniref:Putative MFS-type transporter n=1 Tax=Frigoriglobus tundricola TaxID=2774151 RepID=A0A6M5Z250_9BACT|nr:MFS transporter [Frigoriglobus tundricola]QJW99593.1 putative MFS-type transporter [Frigoriglobus tundricola]
MTNPTPGPVSAEKIAILGAVCLAALVLPLSFAGGAVATPTIGRHLGGGPVALNGITNAFMLTFGSFLMAAGTLADQFGRKRVFVTGVGLFVLFSLALSASPSVAVIDLLRAFQGVAAAAALAGGTAALAQEFEGDARTRAFSMLGTTFGTGLAFGPVLAGVLLEHFGWRSVFASSALVGALALVLGAPRMRETRDPGAGGLDWAGMGTFTGALTLFTVGVIQAPESGWLSPLVVGLLLGSALLLVAFIGIELRTTRPMLDLSLFRYPRFVGVQALPVATCYCYVVLLVLLPLRFMGVEGRSPVDAGLLMIALSAPMLVVPLLAAVLSRWLSAGVLSGIGLLIAAAGLLWLGRGTEMSTGRAVVFPLLLIGFGTGLPWGLMDGLSVSVVPRDRAGMATGIFSTTRVAGEGIALAVVSAVLAALAHSGLRDLLVQVAPGSALDPSEAAQVLASGDLERSAGLLPEVNRSLLLQCHADAFQKLLYVLTGITVVSALVVFAFLGRPPHQTTGPESVAPPAPPLPVEPDSIGAQRDTRSTADIRHIQPASTQLKG